MIRFTVHGSHFTDKQGFTLLELLVAFTILGLILLIIGSSLRLGFKAWERGESIVNETQRIRTFYERFSSEIRSAYPYYISREGEKRLAFKGESDSLGFVTSHVDLNWVGGFKWVSYAVKDGALVLKEKMLPDKELDESKGRESVLGHGVKEIRFKYYDKEKDSYEDSWDSKEKGRLPEIVKVTITFKSGTLLRPGLSFPPFLFSLPVAYSPKEAVGMGAPGAG